jgi:hypothetical protein
MSALVAMNSATGPVVDPRRESKITRIASATYRDSLRCGLVLFTRIALFDPSPSRVILEMRTLWRFGVRAAEAAA